MTTGGPVPVYDLNDVRLADYAALTDARLRKRYEQQHGVLIAEGPAPVRALLSSPYPLRSVLIADERLEDMRDVLDAAAAVGAPVYTVTRQLLYDLVRFKLHQGIIACGWRLPPASLGTVLDGRRRIAVFDGLNDHENLGTLFRSARGLGIEAVVLGPGAADPLYRRCVRVSMGHVLHLPYARVDSLAAIFETFEQRGIDSIALTPDPGAADVHDIDVPADRPVAVLLGAEGPGLSPDALTRATQKARIAMDGGVDSLNVATAGAIAFHALRARR